MDGVIYDFQLCVLLA